MQIKLTTLHSLPQKADTAAFFWFEGQEADPNFNCPIGKMVKYLLDSKEFSGKAKEVRTAYLIEKANNVNKVIVVGMGAKKDLTVEKLRVAVGTMVKKAKELKSKEMLISQLPECDCNIVEVIAEALTLANYKFEGYKSKKADNTLETVSIITATGSETDAMAEGILLGEATNFARDLTGTPVNILSPSALAEQAVLKGNEYGFDTDIWNEEDIIEAGMEAFWQVARGSDNPPRFIIMRHNGNPANPEDVTALVGKGICYDSGGLSLKTRQGMVTMKTDMAGSAAVIGAMCAIAKQNLQANVVGIVAACENIPSAHSYHPGDIIGSMAGKSIHIGSTDAEGRLTLADAVYYAVTTEKATRVLDIATLTGSCVTALGKRVTGVISNDDEFYGRLEAASVATGEMIWRLPTFEHFEKCIEHPEADLNNVGGECGGGTITAALFIGRFNEDKPWIHMDIAGKSYTGEDLGYIAKGPTGVGVRNLYQLVKSYTK